MIFWKMLLANHTDLVLHQTCDLDSVRSFFLEFSMINQTNLIFFPFFFPFIRAFQTADGG